MEYPEFHNLEDTDYDVKNTSTQANESGVNLEENQFIDELDHIIEEIGVLDDDELSELDISPDQYVNPDERVMQLLRDYRDVLKNNDQKKTF